MILTNSQKEELYELINDKMFDFLNVISPPKDGRMQQDDELYESEECISHSKKLTESANKFITHITGF
jgi:predicted transcriptional regulator